MPIFITAILALVSSPQDVLSVLRHLDQNHLHLKEKEGQEEEVEVDLLEEGFQEDVAVVGSTPSFVSLMNLEKAFEGCYFK